MGATSCDRENAYMATPSVNRIQDLVDAAPGRPLVLRGAPWIVAQNEEAITRRLDVQKDLNGNGLKLHRRSQRYTLKCGDMTEPTSCGPSRVAGQANTRMKSGKLTGTSSTARDSIFASLAGEDVNQKFEPRDLYNGRRF